MAKPKQSTLIKELSIGVLHVYTNEPEKEIAGIRGIEGVCVVSLHQNRLPIFVTVDPRYDIGEVADEIRQLLTAKGPSIFKED